MKSPFVGPTSLALSFVAAGLNFRKGDNILIYHDDYPSNVYPWMALAEQGVKVRLLNTRGLGIIRTIDVMGQVDEDTKLVALASNHFISGHRLEHDAIGKFLHEREILFCLDAIQTLGAFPTTVEHVDFLAADAHKWLLGPCGAGVLYVKRDLQAKLNPPVYGWHNVRNPNFVAQEKIEFRSGAAKFEAGTHNLIGLVGLLAAHGTRAGDRRGKHRPRTASQTGVARVCFAGQKLRCSECRPEAGERQQHHFFLFARPGSDSRFT